MTITKINDKKLVSKVLTTENIKRNKVEIKSRLDRVNELKREIRLLNYEMDEFKFKNSMLRNEMKNIEVPTLKLNKGRVPSICR